MCIVQILHNCWIDIWIQVSDQSGPFPTVQCVATQFFEVASCMGESVSLALCSRTSKSSVGNLLIEKNHMFGSFALDLAYRLVLTASTPTGIQRSRPDHDNQSGQCQGSTTFFITCVFRRDSYFSQTPAHFNVLVGGFVHAKCPMPILLLTNNSQHKEATLQCTTLRRADRLKT